MSKLPRPAGAKGYICWRMCVVRRTCTHCKCYQIGKSCKQSHSMVFSERLAPPGRCELAARTGATKLSCFCIGCDKTTNVFILYYDRRSRHFVMSKFCRYRQSTALCQIILCFSYVSRPETKYLLGIGAFVNRYYQLNYHL